MYYIKTFNIQRVGKSFNQLEKKISANVFKKMKKAGELTKSIIEIPENRETYKALMKETFEENEEDANDDLERRQ